MTTTEYERLAIGPLSTLAAALGERVTDIHSRPGPAGLVQCGRYLGKTESLRDIRARLTAKLKARLDRDLALRTQSK